MRYLLLITSLFIIFINTSSCSLSGDYHENNKIETKLGCPIYPDRWGDYPTSVSDDIVELPLDYGFGPLEVRDWIVKNLKKDYLLVEIKDWLPEDLKIDRALIKGDSGYSAISSKCGNNYPKRWVESPDKITRDKVKLPLDYGYGSLSEKYWIIKNIENDYNTVKHIKLLKISPFVDYLLQGVGRNLLKIN